jgi:predicted XRE-type DNA-binding protein
MAHSWDKVKTDAVAAGLDERHVVEIMAEMREQVRSHKLAEIRRSQHMTQAVIAQGMGVAQPRVSAIRD